MTANTETVNTELAGGDLVDGVVVEGVEKSFGAVKALRGITFRAAHGEVLGILGPNGAGKTTMVNVLSTLIAPDSGRAEVAGHDVVTAAADVRRSIMLTGQFAALDDALSGYENLVMFGRLMGLRKRAARARADELITEFDLTDAATRRVGTYSGGMRRRIDIACGLVVRPEVVFLDEPTTGLDPRSRQGVWDLVAGFRKHGITTLLTTQYLEEADALCDRIIVIDHGVVIAEGTADELKARTGGSYCEIVPMRTQDLDAIADALGDLLPTANREALNEDSDSLAIPAPRGAKTLAEALRRLDSAGLELVDIALRRPSLDDVFLQLTGHRAEPEGAPEELSPLDISVRRRLAAPTDGKARP
ncbi:ATP-binding cassette domain-containing protein [Nocardia jejuensis]|uniref:ATP-binding cassette domain-containing protein n=1 Tax=Nocardia jejuensis TaxID=328049 RepID=UPI000B03FAAF|nr:ATP-binding cassette domain-containing protein [Nocardia jejuensis]